MTTTLEHGFTVVELTVVIVIVAILGAIAMPKFAGNSAFAERGYYEELATGLKFAQKYAVATGCAVRMRVDAAGYEARQQQVSAGRCDPADGTWPTPVTLADGEALAGSAPASVAVSPNVTIVFDSLGRSDLGGDQAISVGPFTLTVQAESGYVVAP
jgi:MSHA pilin protein MshC